MMALRSHLFPYRTQKIGRRDATWNHTHSGVVFLCIQLRLTVAVIKLKINVIGWLSKSEDDRNVILIFNNSESTVFHLNVDTMQVIA